MSTSPDLATFAHLLTDPAGRAAVTSFAIGEQLKQFALVREDRGLTREALSEKSGIPVKIITEIEEGRFTGNVGVAQKLAHALDCNMSVSFDFFGSLPAELETMRTNPKSLVPVPFKHDPVIFSGWPGLRSFGPEDMGRVQLVRQLKDWSESGDARVWTQLSHQ